MKLRKIIALLLCAATAMSLFAGCGNNEEPTPNAPTTPAPTPNAPSNPAPSPNAPSTGAASYKEEIVIGIAQEFTSMDPQGTSASLDQMIQDNVFDLICDTNLEVMENRGELAETFEMIEPDLWQFKLYEGVKFHDGTILNVDDVIFTWERSKTSEFASSFSTQVTEIIKIDDLTFQMKLAAPNLDFNYKAASNTWAIQSKEAFETMPEEKAASIGTGPWMFEEFVPGDYVSMVRFEDCTRWPVPNTKRLVFKMLPEASARLIALQTGEIDICMDPSSIDFNTIINDSNLELLQASTRGMRYIAFNLSKEGSPFTDVRVRKAVASAVKRAELIEVARGGYATPAYNLMAKGVWSYTEVDGIPEDIEAAKKLMAEAGYPDGFETKLSFQADTERSDLATVLQAQLAEIGIKAELEPLEAAAFKEQVTVGGEHDFCIGRWTPGMDADGMFRSPLHSSGSSNYAHNKDAKTDELLDGAMAETDPEKRMEMYQELQVYLAEELVPWAPLYQIMTSVAVRAGLEGLGMHPAEIHSFKYVQIPLS